jgi:hypothetical protein
VVQFTEAGFSSASNWSICLSALVRESCADRRYAVQFPSSPCGPTESSVVTAFHPTGVLSQLSGPGPALPFDVMTQEVTSWMRSVDYFNSVAHGGKRAEREEFLRSLYAVEDIVLRRVNPRPLSDLDEIDALIREGENAN